MWHYGIWNHSTLASVGMVHSIWPSQAMWRTHAPTFNKWHKKKKKKKTLHILTHGAIWGCGLTSLVVSINDKIRDIGEKNLTIRSEIWTTNIRSLGFQDIRERVILWGLILQSLKCIASMIENSINIGYNISVCIFTLGKCWWGPNPKRWVSRRGNYCIQAYLLLIQHMTLKPYAIRRFPFQLIWHLS